MIDRILWRMIQSDHQSVLFLAEAFARLELAKFRLLRYWDYFWLQALCLVLELRLKWALRGLLPDGARMQLHVTPEDDDTEE